MAKKYPWIDDDRIPSQAEIDFYGSLDAGDSPKITQGHLDEIGQGEGGENLTPSDVGNNYPPLTDTELEEFDWGFEKYGWKYIFRDGVKVDREGVPWIDPNAGKYPTGTGADDEDPSAENVEADEWGNFPGEPGYNDPNYEVPFQEPGMGEDGEGMPNDAEIAELMNDDNFDTGGNYIGPEGEGNVGEGNQDEPVYGQRKSSGGGYAQRVKGYNPFLKIKKRSRGLKGAFTRGSLRVRKPRQMAI